MIPVIVGAVRVLGTALQYSEYRERGGSIMNQEPHGKWEGSADEWRAYHMERWRGGILINSMGVVGTIFLWLFTSGITWVGWNSWQLYLVWHCTAPDDDST